MINSKKSYVSAVPLRALGISENTKSVATKCETADRSTSTLGIMIRLLISNGEAEKNLVIISCSLGKRVVMLYIDSKKWSWPSNVVKVSV